MNRLSQAHVSSADGSLKRDLNRTSEQNSNREMSHEIFSRYVVLEVICDVDSLDTDLLSSKYQLNVQSIKNCPNNSVIARVSSNFAAGVDQYRVLMPMIQTHMMLPVKPGEHVWAVFPEQSQNSTFGYWLTRITEINTTEDLSHTHPDRKYSSSDSSLNSQEQFDGVKKEDYSFDDGQKMQDGSRVAASKTSVPLMPKYEEIIKNAKISKIVRRKPIPRFKKRPQDFVLQAESGILYVGSKRNSSHAKYDNGEATSDDELQFSEVRIVSGMGKTEVTGGPTVKNSLSENELDKKSDSSAKRKTEGDFDLENDATTVLASENIDISEYAKTKFDIQKKGSGFLIKTDNVCLISRKSLKLIIQENENTPEELCTAIILDGDNITFVPSQTGVIKLGKNASKAILTNPLAQNANGNVVSTPIVSTIGSQVGGGGANGEFSRKVLVE